MTQGYAESYFETVFVAEPLPAGLSREFGIVSGYETTGESWTPERNREADARLAAEIASWPHARIIGQSPDGQHEEPGWAVACPQPVAIELGRRFLQDAIYWVSDDVLYIVDCRGERPPARVGRFSERLKGRPAESPASRS